MESYKVSVKIGDLEMFSMNTRYISVENIDSHSSRLYIMVNLVQFPTRNFKNIFNEDHRHLFLKTRDPVSINIMLSTLNME